MRVSTWLVIPVVLGALCFALSQFTMKEVEDAWYGHSVANVTSESAQLKNQKYVGNHTPKTVGLEDHKDHPLEESFCCCTIDTISSGTKDIAKLLNNITKRPFFRFFKVNLEKPCPYWAVQLLCTSEKSSCQVCSCDENDVPEALKYSHDMSDPSISDSHVLYTAPNPLNVDQWGIWRDADTAASYVDLFQNPEGNTGYSGPMASRVWQAIYKENCMTDTSEEGVLNPEKQCKEQLIFKKLISGLHTSITMHVATFFHKDVAGTSPLKEFGVLRNPNISYFPNCVMYGRVVSNKEFVNNLYVLYQFILRALTKSRLEFLSDLNAFNSGSNGVPTTEDLLLHAELRELFNNHLLCSPTFDETRFLESAEAHRLVPQMKQMMYNITTLMDCVTCEKCRVWGKLQTMGIATALRIVMVPEDTVSGLSRGEKVSLINLARQLAISVQSFHVLKAVCQKMEAAQK
ncbi:putative endoplasmic reticulum oxidoreductin [Trypanosoma rangeli]|uniref:Putative endoplasmic reticulum oxidoreductin n=1 Tax=Trypanosoma rangeli TaxID=5698 RepID=A0A422NE38_TRYRA|nr:putative endoplasmic reticulum oxidoreductin [Trypanosoma rangeli]RNF03774.1 putative endoplasmic reticulum oxidoreductin [Trypanosoma rangeli]|eukprot:RNF03774.1 putative endoplasmic reticulum oxidoreductin [Trypanosoma rangeli]